MEPITDDEIAYAERLLLPEGETFNEARRKVIRDMTSINVQACPGSGKTTVLLAKLLILANRMPFENGRGICVLTHTNVAINEIKDRLSTKTGALFQYPNFFGTFQSFVDKYLAVPASIFYHNCRPERIDDQAYNRFIDYEYHQLQWKNPFSGMLYQQKKKDLDEEKLTQEEFKELKKNTFRKLRLDYVKEQVLTDIGSDKAFCSFRSNTGLLVRKVKEEIISKGVLHFDDAYSLALRYLHDFSADLSEVFQKRFSYIFIDEMQDTDSHQNKIIDTLFDSTAVVIQKIGDTNQAIFGRVKSDSLWTPNSLPINDSKRFHNAIAKRVKTISLEENNQITGNNSSDLSIQPTIIAFENPLEVIEKYGDLIVQSGLSQKEVKLGKPNIYRAIGWVKDNRKGELCISSYWHGYIAESQTKKNDFNNLSEYLHLDSTQIGNGGKFFRNRVLSALIKALSITGNCVSKNGIVRSHSKTTLVAALKSITPNAYEQFNIKLSNWYLEVAKGKDVSVVVATYIKGLIGSCFTINNEPNLDKFLNSQNSPTAPQITSSDQIPNRYLYSSSNGETLDIDVSTIHGAKGETHTATLYLETYYDKSFESKRLMDFIKGNYNSVQAGKPRHIETLKMAYVGMTRPSHFLCVAIHKDHIVGHESDLRTAGWVVNEDLIKSD